MARVDYYHGQTLEEIVYGDEDWQWALRLSGGAVVKNWDKRRTSPPEISAGEGLLMTVMEETATTLKFGHATPGSADVTWAGDVVFTPTQYSITDPTYATEEEFPQRNVDEVVENAEVVYPEELLAREAEGPENQEDEIATEEYPEEAEADDGAFASDGGNA